MYATSYSINKILVSYCFCLGFNSYRITYSVEVKTTDRYLAAAPASAYVVLRITGPGGTMGLHLSNRGHDRQRGR